MSLPRRSPLAALLLLGLLGCQQGPVEATQVVVVVGGDPLIEQLEVTVQTENGLNQSDNALLTLEPREGGRRLPTSFTVVPDDPEHPEAARFRLVVVGRRREGADYLPLVRSIVEAGFRAGKTTLLPLVLSPECAEETCGCDWDRDRCEQSCLPSNVSFAATCDEVPSYTQLEEIEPGQELEALKRGTGACAAGELLDASGQCSDLDECAFGMDLCDADPPACVNEIGTQYGCRCPSGYRGNGVGEQGCQPVDS